MKTFEYKILPRIVQEDELNELGRQGWDLISAEPGSKWILKREHSTVSVPEPRRNPTPSYGRDR